jgi:predicted  nucleic acid-binding Zn-ribbon protein
MARMKKPENETQDETITRRMLEIIANHATRSEKTAWERKRNNMDKLVKQLRPLEDKIMEIRAKMNPIYDEIATLRNDMVEDCIHPYDMLVHQGDHIDCKFCGKSLKPMV